MPTGAELQVLKQMAKSLGLGIGKSGGRSLATKVAAAVESATPGQLAFLEAKAAKVGFQVTGGGLAGTAGRLAQGAKGVAGRLGGFAGVAGLAAGGVFAAGLLVDWIMGLYERAEDVEKISKVIADPYASTQAMAEGYVEEATAKKVEMARMRILQQQIATTNPEMYATLHSQVAGDSIPRLGPGEARVGGSALFDNDMMDRAIANSDLWD